MLPLVRFVSKLHQRNACKYHVYSVIKKKLMDALLHAAHEAKDGYQAVVVCSEDTDVFIMLLAFHNAIGVPLFQECSTRIWKIVIDIKKLVLVWKCAKP